MRLELLAHSLLLIFDREPVVVGRKRRAVEGAIPSITNGADLLDQLAETVKYIDPRIGYRVEAVVVDLPAIIDAVAVGREEPWVAYDAERHG